MINTGRDTMDIRFTATSADIKTMRELRDLGLPRWYRRALAIGLAVYVLLLVLTIAYVVFTRHGPAAHDWTGVIVCMVAASAQIALTYATRRSMLPPLEDGQNLGLRFDDAGITIVGTKSEFIPWRRISMIEDKAGAFVITGMFGSILPIPKRALADNGNALWAYFNDRLIGKYHLIRPAASRRVIIPSAAR